MFGNVLNVYKILAEESTFCFLRVTLMTRCRLNYRIKSGTIVVDYGISFIMAPQNWIMHLRKLYIRTPLNEFKTLR